MKIPNVYVPEKYAVWLIAALFGFVVFTTSLVFLPWSLAWWAWGFLGCFGIVIYWRSFIVVQRRAKDAPTDERKRTISAIVAGVAFALTIAILGFLDLIQLRHAFVSCVAVWTCYGLIWLLDEKR